MEIQNGVWSEVSLLKGTTAQIGVLHNWLSEQAAAKSLVMLQADCCWLFRPNVVGLSIAKMAAQTHKGGES